jgi:hypothetical protein
MAIRAPVIASQTTGWIGEFDGINPSRSSPYSWKRYDLAMNAVKPKRKAA